MTLPSDWDYLLRSYAPPNQGGRLLLETWHRGEASKDIELAVYRVRMARGEVAYVEVIARDPHTPTVTVTT